MHQKNYNWIENNVYKYRIEEVDATTIQAHDTIMHNDKMYTVCKKDIKNNSFMGKTIFGAQYNSGIRKIIKVIFYNPLFD